MTGDNDDDFLEDVYFIWSINLALFLAKGGETISVFSFPFFAPKQT